MEIEDGKHGGGASQEVDWTDAGGGNGSGYIVRYAEAATQEGNGTIPNAYKGIFRGATVRVASDEDLQELLSRAESDREQAKRGEDYWIKQWRDASAETEQLKARLNLLEAECESYRSYRLLAGDLGDLAFSYAELANAHIALVRQTALFHPETEEPEPECQEQEIEDDADLIWRDEEHW